MDNNLNEISTQGVDQGLLAAIVHELNLARRHVSSYPKGHPVVSKSCEQVVRLFEDIFADRDAFSIGVARETLLLGGQSLERLTPVVKGLARTLSYHGIALLTFRKGLAAEEIERFNGILMAKRGEIAAAGGIEKVAQEAGLEHILITRIRYDSFQGSGDGSDSEGRQVEASSSLWESFVRRLLAGAPSSHGSLTPEELAGILNESSGDASSIISESLETSIWERSGRETLQAAELESLRKIGEFAGNLSPELRRRFLESVFNSCREQGGDSLEILPHLPDAVIPELFDYMKENRDALSPLALSVVEKLAGNSFMARQLQDLSGSGDEAGEPRQEDGFKILFEEEIQEEFVPREYLETLKDLAASSYLPEPGDEELEQLKQTLAGERVESSVGAIILASLNEVAPERLDALKRSLIELSRYFLELGDFRALEEMHDRLSENCHDDAHAASALRNEVLRVFGTPDFVAEVLNGLEVWGKEKYRDIGSLMQKIRNPFVEPLLDRLAAEENRVLRRFCLDQLVKMGEIAKEAVVARLGDSRWYFVRNLVIILRHIGGADIPGILRRVADFPHARVRQAVMETCIRLRSPEGDRLLLQDLASDDGDTRLQAIHLAGRSRDGRVRQALLHLLEKRGLSPERFAEKKAAIRALALIGAGDALPTLGRMLGARHFLRARQHDMLKQEIILTLGQYRDPLALKLLRRAAESSKEILSLPALEILREMEGSMAEGALFREMQEFIRLLVSAVSSASLYSPSHRQVLRLSGEAYSGLRNALELESEISILFIEDEVVCNNVPLEGSLSLGKFLQLFVSRGIEHLVFSRDVEEDELRRLVVELSQKGDAALEASSSAHIRFGRLKRGNSEAGSNEGEKEGVEAPGLEDIREHEREAFNEIYENIRNNKKFNMAEINGIVRSLIHAFKQVSTPYMAFAAISSLDRYTFIHSTNVCVLNLAQAMAMGIDGRLLHDVGVAGMLHDVGKLFIPEEILSKPHALTASEMEMIRQHPVRGAHYLLDLPGVPRLAVVCAYEHHMRYDAAGYPPVHDGWRQNMCSQMTAVSDFFDALRTKRSYRDSLDYDTIAAMMLEGAGTLFHPVLTRNFLCIFSRRPKEDATSLHEKPSQFHSPLS